MILQAGLQDTEAGGKPRASGDNLLTSWAVEWRVVHACTRGGSLRVVHTPGAYS